MTTYSNSRVTAFENCPYQYKLRYIDKKKPEISTTIEAFMGDMVHQSLDDLYKRKKFKQRVAEASLIKFYRDLWAKNYSEDILIAKEDQGLTADNYRKMGEKFLSDYYKRMKPFEEMTILGLETQDRMTLPDGNQWHVRIDKLGCDNEGNYFVCDYKTNARMKDQEEADSDRQLAMYSIWVKDRFKDCKSVKLIWHMLAFNKDAISERTEEQLERLQNELVEKIKEIENAKEFPTNVTALCNYCGFKSECPSFKHQAELEKIETVEEFKEDAGVKLVDEFSEVKKTLSELNKKEDELKDKLVQYAKQFGIDIVYGSNMKAGVKEIDKVVLPENKVELIAFLKEKGIWDCISMINFMGFQSKVLKGELGEEVREKIDVVKDYRLSLSKRKDVEEE
ncbi:MAG: PD-(D/E)XK nuclease family protein [Nanoarchaeota archaeon]